jgi:hypothetical protein
MLRFVERLFQRDRFPTPIRTAIASHLKSGSYSSSTTREVLGLEIQISTEPSAIAAVVKLKAFIQDETVFP